MNSPFNDFVAVSPEADNFTPVENFHSPLQDPETVEDYVPSIAPQVQKLAQGSKWHKYIKNTVLCGAEPFVYGKDTYDAMVKAIRATKGKEHFIYILGWMFDINFPLIPNDTRATMKALLQEAADRGVEIRLMIWNNPYYSAELTQAEKALTGRGNTLVVRDNVTYGSPSVASALQTLRETIAGVPTAVRLVLDRMDIGVWNDIKKYSIATNEGSHHEKLIIVKNGDGVTGFCGGIDINPDRIGAYTTSNMALPITGFNEQALPVRWPTVDFKPPLEILHDVHCRLTGHGAYALLQRFLWRWNQFKTYRGTSYPTMYTKLKGEAEKPPPPARAGQGVSNVKIVHTYNAKNGVDYSHGIYSNVERAIRNAESSVHFECQYMISVEIAKLLHDKVAGNKNFKVTILTQEDKYARADIHIIKRMRKAFMDTLYGTIPRSDTRIRVYVLDTAVPFPGHHKVHSKLYIVDNELAIIGSANCSRRSMTHDSETAAVIFNEPPYTNDFVKTLSSRYDKISHWKVYKPDPDVLDIDEALPGEVAKFFSSGPMAASLLAAINLVGGQVAILAAIRYLVAVLPGLLRKIEDPYDARTKEELEMAELSEEAFEEGLVMEQPHEPGETFAPSFAAHEFDEEEPVNEQDQFTGYGNEESDDREENYQWEQDASTQETAYGNEAADQDEIMYEAPKPVKACEGRTCWAKGILNKQLGLNLALNNTPDEATKKAIGDFQQQKGLSLTRSIDFATERALLEADAVQRLGAAAATMMAEAKTRVEDWTAQGQANGVKNKPQHILNSFRDPRTVWAFVLHHMAFKRRGGPKNVYSAPEGYVNTGAHFCIMLDGRIIQLHPLSRMIWHGNCLSPRSVAVEFEGNFPNIKGKWWIDKDSKVQNRDVPTQAQYDAGQFLTRYLKAVLNTTHILAHRQGSASRENDPGPDIWFNVGQWAIDKLGLTDGGASFKCGDGNTILADWRTWGNKSASLIKKEEPEMAAESEEEDVQYEDWLNGNLEETVPDLEADHEAFLDEQTDTEQDAETMNWENIQPADLPVVLARTEKQLPHSGRRVTFYKRYDKATKKFLGETYDEQGNELSEAEVTTLEHETTSNVNNKIHPGLASRLPALPDTAGIDIAVWLALDINEPAKTNYTAAQLATMPAEIAGYRQRMAAMIKETVRKVTIERSGIEVLRVSELLPLFFAKASRRTIDLIKNDPLVLGIFYNDKKYFLSLDTSLSRSGAAEAQTEGLSNLGKDIKVAVWEDAPDVLTNLTIEGYFDSTTPTTSSHARLVSAIIKNKETGKPKGYAPNCKLYSANFGTGDLHAPLEWAVKQGCSVINRSFHVADDQVNGGMQLSDFITDSLAVLWPYPMIVQASGNTGQGDDTAIVPSTNEYVNHKGYNSIAVGSHDEQTERKISTFSTFRNPTSPRSDRELPEICALGENITAVGLVNWGGTSFASPAVAGSAAILQSLSPQLKVYPEAIRAVLMAGAKRNVDGGLWYADLKETPKVDQKDGTGALNIYESIKIAKKPYQPKKVALDKGWDCGRFDAAGFGPDKFSTRVWKITVPKDKKHVKVTLAWNSTTNYFKIWGFEFLKNTTLDMDFDLLVYDEKGTLVAASSSYDNSYEIVDYIAKGGETLTVKVKSYAIKPGAWSYFGIGWTTF
ncbi:S8 family serine peptidase [Paraflavitalea sp. CAU 1676]|uniref:S8 family serine peptidase n=1 Tax=Paraflavitalea sp. CAU 1676 TaxID=3032598 RepID=UPI0023DBA928|nr:S8 family serine peptidase [Paraflavitalea sp. CAU 1676]MDF2188381.1 S8 family serine peptidase [Paraflavitalea sp. CAU 1676]